MKTNDEIIRGKLAVQIYAHPTPTCPDHNDPATARYTVVVGLDAARAWVDQHGGYASLDASMGRDDCESEIAGWSIMRVTDMGHRCFGWIRPIEEQETTNPDPKP